MGNVAEIHLESWQRFDAEMSGVFELFERTKARTEEYVSEPLFRGQADSRWRLATTLERFSAKQHSISEYYRKVVSIVAREVTSYTGKPWPVPDPGNVVEADRQPPPGYEFMIYLRHHGFPSPLLDWSQSPYVAAFFAFAPRPQSGCDSVAIYEFREFMGGAKVSDLDRAHIIGCGSTVETHERHYLQRCEYTICRKRLGDKYVYCNHEEAVDDREGGQDVLTKYIIPATERETFRKKLDLMNISAYSLFRDEASLMQTLAYRVMEKQGL